jgi:hypothetical protein
MAPRACYQASDDDNGSTDKVDVAVAGTPIDFTLVKEASRSAPTSALKQAAATSLNLVNAVQACIPRSCNDDGLNKLDFRSPSRITNPTFKDWQMMSWRSSSESGTRIRSFLMLKSWGGLRTSWGMSSGKSIREFVYRLLPAFVDATR